MIGHLVKWLKAPPKQIEIDSTPETGRRKFIDQHGNVGRLNKGSMGISQKSLGDFLPQDIVGPEYVHVFRLHYDTLEIIHQCLFWYQLSCNCQNKTKKRFMLGSWYMKQARTWPCQAAYSNASGFSGSVTGITVVEISSGKASIWSIVLAGRL
ncbi:uncharacterized protein TNCV_3598121 [Trichonephila clavipes]|nr:uncharacterized protein TNCV_3598121 [Trichonephila clavipes]